MSRVFSRFLLVFVLLLPAAFAVPQAHAEKVADLAAPTRYVNDYAQILSPTAQQNLEDLCLEVHQQANAELFVVTIKSLDDGQSLEEFTSDLIDKWKIGKKGVDRSALILRVVSPHGLRVETGYGLEGILPDAKVGRILDQSQSSFAAGNTDQGLLIVTQGVADVIAADAQVTLTPIVHHYRRVQAAPQPLGLGQILLGIGFIALILILIATGHAGWAFYLILNLLGGGGGGGGRDDDDRGGGFGGVGGGGSGGGGASRDF